MARPNLSYLKNLILFIVGAPCGVLTGLTGMTNSFVVAPLLGWLAGLRGARLIGSTLAVSSFSALTGIIAYAQVNVIDASLTVGMALGFLTGAAYAQRVGSDRSEFASIGRTIGVAAATVLSLLMMANAHGLIRGHIIGASAFGSHWAFAAAIMLGVVTGIAGRVLDLAGFLIVPALYYVAGTSMVAAQGSAVAILLVSSIPATFEYARRGHADPQTSVWVSFGALFGALWGSQVAQKHWHDRDMLMVYAIVMLAMVIIRLMSTPPASAAPAPAQEVDEGREDG